jgi:asparagine synthase (glutamine-hydrolysing)
MPKVNYTSSIDSTYAYNGSHKKPQVLQYLKKNEFYGHMQRILKKVDLTSMAHGLEVRVPFLDKEMITFSNRIESGFTIKHNEAKLLIKSGFYDFLPKSIVNTEKKGFAIPITSWLKNELRADFTKTVLENEFYGSEHVDLNFLNKQIEGFFKEDPSIDVWGLWHVYAWQKWAIHHELA